MMDHQFSEEQLKEIAGQLSKPDGENGLKTAERMNENNIGMTKSAIDSLNLATNDVVLEVGPGNAAHLPYVLEKAAHLQYFAVDVSPTMIEAASKLNAEYVKLNQAHFYLVEGEELPFPTLRFDKIFTVNTLYFWKHPDQFLLELKRILKPGGTLSICFADKTFMDKLPFTIYGFTLYHKETVENLLVDASFKQIHFEEHYEKVQSNAKEFVERIYFVVTAMA